MARKRPTIGRTFTSSILGEENTASGSQQHVFVLSTGRHATFTEMILEHDRVAEDTFVVEETNGRDQTALTADSLKDITRTLRFQQFYPCIGIQNDERIEILDGSRRRASALLCHVGLRVLVTREALTVAEARHLAKDLQTSLQHNIREVGLRLQRMKEAGMNQKEIAEKEGLSQAKVTRALQAAAAPRELVALFPVQSELTFSDYRLLFTAGELLSAKGIEYAQLIDNIMPEMEPILTGSDLAEDEVKNRLMKMISREAASLADKTGRDRAVLTPLWSFSEKDRFARKRVKGRTFSYEFNRLPKELQDELDRMIGHILKKNLERSQT